MLLLIKKPGQQLAIRINKGNRIGSGTEWGRILIINYSPKNPEQIAYEFDYQKADKPRRRRLPFPLSNRRSAQINYQKHPGNRPKP